MEKPINFKISKVSSKDTIYFRHRFLRSDQSVNESIFPNDDHPLTVHFGAFVDEKLVGVLSAYMENSSKLNADNQWRLRGLAVLPEYRKHGIGKKIMLESMGYVKKHNGSYVWGNARESAWSFHEQLDFSFYEDSFHLERNGLGGPVQLKVKFMYKKL